MATGSEVRVMVLREERLGEEELTKQVNQWLDANPEAEIVDIKPYGVGESSAVLILYSPPGPRPQMIGDEKLEELKERLRKYEPQTEAAGETDPEGWTVKD